MMFMTRNAKSFPFLKKNDYSSFKSARSDVFYVFWEQGY